MLSWEMTESGSNILTTSFFAIIILIEIIKFIKKKNNKNKSKKKEIQSLVNTLQNIENKYHKSFIERYWKNNKDNN